MYSWQQASRNFHSFLRIEISNTTQSSQNYATIGKYRTIIQPTNSSLPKLGKSLSRVPDVKNSSSSRSAISLRTWNSEPYDGVNNAARLIVTPSALHRRQIVSTRVDGCPCISRPVKHCRWLQETARLLLRERELRKLIIDFPRAMGVSALRDSSSREYRLLREQ